MFNAKHSHQLKSSSLFACLIFLSLCVLIIPCQSCSSFKSNSRIKLDNNGYQNILIAIEDEVEENPYLIERLKTTFTEASELLFNVTKKRAYFKDIKILIPNSWSLDNYEDNYDLNSFEYYDNKIDNATWENYDSADICIESRSAKVIDTPYVVNYASSCGEPSLHLHFTPEYFLKKDRSIYTFGPYNNVLVHEWAHFRYGVFDEFPHKTTENNQEFYINSNGEIEATRCSESLTGRIKNISHPTGKCEKFLPNGLPSNDCSFEDDILNSDPSKNIGSLMYKPSLKHLTAFCDNDPRDMNTFHNKFAPTLQNKECNGRSVWEVLRNHEDFKNSKNMPNNHIVDIKPKFKVIKRRYNKIVLLIDKSLKYKSPNVLAKIKAAINDYVKQMINMNDLIGIIHFESFAEIILSMTLTDDSQIRQKIYELSIPKYSKGVKNSNIYNALSLGIRLLKTTNTKMDAFTPTGGRIVLITNSKADLKYPNRHLIVNDILKNKITVDVVEISDSKDENLSSLSTKTDGLNFLINNNNELLDITDSLVSLANRDIKSKNQIVELSDSFFLQNQQPINSQEIFVDDTISVREDSVLTFKFNFEKLKEHLDVEVVDPKNKKYMLKTMDKCRDTSLFETERSIDKTKQEVVCKFEHPQQGRWFFKIINSVDQLFYVKLKVFVYFKQTKEINSYYPNYYSNRISKIKRNVNGDTQKRTLKNIDTIELDAKWSKTEINYPSDTQIIYASVSKNLQPILNASVKALIHRPTGDYISLELYDNGLNADRYANDGVYTRYFSNYNEDGVYFGRIELRTNAFTKVNNRKIIGMNSFDHFPTIGVIKNIDDSIFDPIDQVQRTSFIGSFSLSNYNVEKDLMKPSMIKDLRVTNLDEKNKLVTIRFTSPGDNADMGTAERYEIKASYDPEHLFKYTSLSNNYNNQDESRSEAFISIVARNASFENLTPNQGGYEEFIEIDTNNFNKNTVSIMIRAVDANDNYGRWSHILTIKLNKKIQFSPKLKHYEREESQFLKSETEESDQNIYWEFFIFLIVMFCTIGVTQIVFLIVLTTIDIIDRRRNRQNQIKPVRV